MDKKSRILVVDDDPGMGALLEDFLKPQGYTVETYTSAVQAYNYLQNSQKEDPWSLEQIHLIITDLRMPGMDGLSFIEKCKALAPRIPIILITAFGSIDSAIEATKKGAFSYIVKPFKLSEMDITVERALQFGKLNKQNEILRGVHRSAHSYAGIIGKSAAMQSVFDLIQRVSGAMANVLIQGESGTGKELVAKAIHSQSPRTSKPFVAINCTAIPENLLESELFGHVKGSFTGAISNKKGLFEEAHGGTLFLDEIGDMDLALQAKLLRVLQDRKIRAVGDTHDKPIDVRIIAASHKDLKAGIRDGRFREDLFYRLSVIPVILPPLRHRLEDIPLLAYVFLDKYSSLNGTHVETFSKEAMQVLMGLSWEGNVRELENVIERAVVLCRGAQIEVSDLPRGENSNSEMIFAQASEELPTLEDFEKRYIKYVLDRTGGRKEKAAHILGVNRRTLYRKEREYGWVSDDDALSEDSYHSASGAIGHNEK
ncbi:MAG: sigma-54-dependent transcriptional regulator [Pseudobdellovibrionaceae bacterium]